MHTLHLPETVKTGGIILPPSARDGIEKDRREVAMEFTTLRGELDSWTRELRRIDPRLRMVKAHERIAPDSPLKAGYYHVVLDAPGHPSTVMPVEYDDGSFRELGSHVYTMIEQNDLWNDRVTRANRVRNERLKAAMERQAERDRQDKVQEFNEKWRSVNGSQISVSRSV